jgi:hypothetical protein
MQPPVRTFPEESIERTAYASISGIPVLEPNDANRLGYHVYLYCTQQITTLREAIHVAQARMTISKEEAFARIKSALAEKGITVTE